MTALPTALAHWDTPEGRPYMGSLIDEAAYRAKPENIGCMCAQGQALHLLGGWTAEMLMETGIQRNADLATARLLNISVTHSVLLRQINDSVPGAPSIVLTDPGKVLGDQWSKLLDFWWFCDQLDDASGEAAGAAAWAAAWEAARAAAWEAAGAAAGAAAWAAARAAAWEIQATEIFRAAKRPFYFLSMFGIASPDDIPARPDNYGVLQT